MTRSSGQQNLALAPEQEGFQDYLSAGSGRGRKRHFARFDGLADALDVPLIALLGRVVVGLVGENEREDALGDDVLPVVVPAHRKGTIPLQRPVVSPSGPPPTRRRRASRSCGSLPSGVSLSTAFPPPPCTLRDHRPVTRDFPRANLLYPSHALWPHASGGNPARGEQRAARSQCEGTLESEGGFPQVVWYVRPELERLSVHGVFEAQALGVQPQAAAGNGFSV